MGYPTAMDVFVIICLMSVFAALCEFAIINFISVTLSRRKAREQELKEAEEKNLEKAKELIEKAGKVMQTLDARTSSGDPPLIVVNVCFHLNKVSVVEFQFFLNAKKPWHNS